MQLFRRTVNTLASMVGATVYPPCERCGRPGKEVPLTVSNHSATAVLCGDPETAHWRKVRAQRNGYFKRLDDEHYKRISDQLE